MEIQTVRWWRVSGVVVAMLGLGMFGASSAGAEEICRPNGGLALVDSNGDGVVTQGEVQAFVDTVGDVEGADRLRAIVSSWPANVSGIRYANCTEDSTGGGSGTGNNGGGTGTDTGTDGGTGTGDGSGTSGGDGSGNGSDDGTGTGEGGSNNPTVVVMIDGTPTVVDAVTGLPATGQGAGVSSSDDRIAAFAILGVAGLALAGAGTFIGRTRRTG